MANPTAAMRQSRLRVISRTTIDTEQVTTAIPMIIEVYTKNAVPMRSNIPQPPRTRERLLRVSRRDNGKPLQNKGDAGEELAQGMRTTAQRQNQCPAHAKRGSGETSGAPRSELFYASCAVRAQPVRDAVCIARSGSRLAQRRAFSTFTRLTRRALRPAACACAQTRLTPPRRRP